MDSLDKHAWFRPKDLIEIRDGFMSFGFGLPGLVLGSVPSKGGMNVKYLGTDGQIYEKPQRWFRVLKSHET